MQNREKSGRGAETAEHVASGIPLPEDRKLRLVFAWRIDIWNKSLINDIRYYSGLLPHLADKKREGMVHNPALYRSPEKEVYEEGKDEKGNKRYIKRSGKKNVVEGLPLGTIASRNRPDMDFGWEKGKPHRGFHDAYEEALALFQFSLECQGFADQLLKEKSGPAWGWIRARKILKPAGSVGDIQDEIRSRRAIETASFGLFFDAFAPPRLKRMFATAKNVRTFEKCLEPLKNIVALAQTGG